MNYNGDDNPTQLFVMNDHGDAALTDDREE